MHDNGRSFRLLLPPATRALLLANLTVFAVNALLFGRLSQPSHGAFFACSWPALWEGYGLGLLRLLTYQFTHAFTDITHLLMNMLVLWGFGSLAEQRLGVGGLCRLYLWGGFVGAMVHIAIAAVQGDLAVPLIGASGACYALLVYGACLDPHALVPFFVVHMPRWVFAALLASIGVYQQFVELVSGYGGGVSHGAHLGGAALGWLAFRAGWFADFLTVDGDRPAGLLQRWLLAFRAAGTARAAAAAAAEEATIDALLVKVKQHGLPSLSAQERKVLARASERAQRH